MNKFKKRHLLIIVILICGISIIQTKKVDAIDSPESDLVITNSEVSDITVSSAKIYWQSNSGIHGEYRYSENQSDLANLTWKTDDVINGDTTGNNFGSMIDIANLKENTKYYFEVRQSMIYGASGGYLYGEAKIIEFMTSHSKPDFIVTDIKIEQKEGDVGKYIYIIVKNIGEDVLVANKIVSIDIKDLDTGHIYKSGITDNFVSGYTKEIPSGNIINSKISSTYRLKATIDTTNSYEESNENNNTFTETIIIGDTNNLPDLAIKEDSVLFYVNDMGSRFIYIDFEDKNKINDNYQNWSVEAKINNINLPISLVSFSPLDYKMPVNFQVPSDIIDGVYEVQFTIDKDNEINESNEDNNTFTKTIIIGATNDLPDLTIKSVDMSYNKELNKIEGKIIIKNIGNKEAVSRYNFVGLRIHVNDGEYYFDWESLEVDSDRLFLNVSESKIFDFTIKTPDFKIGDNKITFYIDRDNSPLNVDSDGHIYESNESNNVFEKYIIIPRIYASKIVDVWGNKDGYAPGTEMKLIIKAIDKNNEPASNDKGYHIQYYVFNSEETDFNGTWINKNSYNAYYDNQDSYWHINYIVPESANKYNLKMTLYCSVENSRCWNDLVDKDNESKKNISFIVDDKFTDNILNEQVKCVFKNSNKIQECYLAGDNDKFKCSGKDSCVINVSGEEGEKFTWKSTCEEYNYTKINGENKVIEFNCLQGDNIIQINNNASNLFQNKLDTILTELNQLRDIVKEQQTQIKYLTELKKGITQLSKTVESAINNFITYGVDDNTKRLGAGERAAVMHSFKSAFNKLPETEEELADAIKIANGRWPSLKSKIAEKQAKKQFEKIYKRIANMDNANDNAAITIMAYGLRQKAENRNLESERTGIKTFQHIYGYHPSTTKHWNIMQSITYSGSSRGIDTDGDLLTDKREKELGTDPNNPDTDRDGHLDGVEVANGFDPLN